MLRHELTHPALLSALATAGHGAKVLIADGNYPCSTAVNPRAAVVYLNLCPGVVRVDEILRTVLTAVTVEGMHAMKPDTGEEPEIFAIFRDLVPAAPLELLSRGDFYAAARGPDIALAIASGDQRLYANLMLTVGVVSAPQRAG